MNTNMYIYIMERDTSSRNCARNLYCALLKGLQEQPRFMVVESGFDKDTIDESIIEKVP